jgi:hypothetical protein
MGKVSDIACWPPSPGHQAAVALYAQAGRAQAGKRKQKNACAGMHVLYMADVSCPNHATAHNSRLYACLAHPCSNDLDWLLHWLDPAGARPN